jgi:hypothetical protein
MRLEWINTHYYSGQLLAYCTSAERQMVMILEQLTEWMSEKVNRSTRREPAPVLLCPPPISYEMNWIGIRAVAVGSRTLTAWVAARQLTN